MCEYVLPCLFLFFLSLVLGQLVKTLKDLAEKEDKGTITEKEKRNPAYFYRTPEGFEAQRHM